MLGLGLGQLGLHVAEVELQLEQVALEPLERVEGASAAPPGVCVLIDAVLAVLPSRPISSSSFS
jgi:hypothetical protein